MSHNTRTSQEMKYYTGYIAYHKKRNSNYWKGPGTVGQYGQQVLVKHSSTYIRFHPYQLQLLNTTEEKELNTCLNENDSDNKKKYQEERKESDSNNFQPFSYQNYENNIDDDSNLQEEDIPVTIGQNITT